MTNTAPGQRRLVFMNGSPKEPDMQDYRGSFCVAVLLVLLTNCGDAQCNPIEPQATFALKDGFVEFVLRKDGRPVANATILIIDEKGIKFGEGETGPEGETAFPLPPHSSFVVEIKAGDRTADPIRLFKTDAGVEPARVLLSYGLRPCCRSIKSPVEVGAGEQVQSPPLTNIEPLPWQLLIPVFGAVSITGVFVFMVWRQNAAGSRAKEKQWKTAARKRNRQ